MTKFVANRLADDRAYGAMVGLSKIAKGVVYQRLVSDPLSFRVVPKPLDNGIVDADRDPRLAGMSQHRAHATFAKVVKGGHVRIRSALASLTHFCQNTF